MAKNSFQNRSEKSSLSRAFHFLSFRSRSEKEMRDFLSKNELEAEDTIIRLKELDLINDAKFTKEFVNRTKGKKLLSIELKRKGIPEEVISDQLSVINEIELAEKFLNKKKNIKDDEQVKRLLYARGFSWDTIEKVIKKRYN